MASPVVGRRWVDPEVVAAIAGYLSTLPPEELAETARLGGNMLERVRATVARMGPFDFLGPALARAALGAERVEELAGYDDADFAALLDAVADSRPRHGAILAANRPWALSQMRALRDYLVNG